MIFTKTDISGAFIIEPEKINDKRGFFARLWCQKEFAQHSLSPNLTQINCSFNEKKFTVRGMHYQLSPHEEAKLVYCSRGAIYDVVVDLRPSSKTYKQWFNVELNEEKNNLVYLPEGCAHGYMTLRDNTEVVYHVSEFFSSESYSGVRWDDPAFKIKWPKAEQIIISDKDKNYPDFKG